MEGLTRLVTESLARHGFDRPLDYRRLHWSRWFRCDSHHSLLIVPSKPGVFALAEEITHVATSGSPVPPSEASGPVWDRVSDPVRPSAARQALAASTPNPSRRMLAVTQFFEDDDMAFVLDRMLSRHNLMCSRLASGRYFVRFVVVEDPTQRRSICAALNQWLASAAEKATGIGSHFASSLELTPATEYIPGANETQQSLFASATATHVAADAFVHPAEQSEAHRMWDRVSDPVRANEARQDFATDAHVARAPSPATAGTISMTAPQLDSGAATNIHCPTTNPSGL
jgi:hypothetical protein